MSQGSNSTQQPGDRQKDPMIKFRGVQEGQNSKGGDRVTLTLGGDKNTANQQIQELIDVLQANLEAPRGVKIDLHISDKEYEGRSFRSAIAFVRAVQDMPFGGARGAGPSTATDTAAKVAKFTGKTLK